MESTGLPVRGKASPDFVTGGVTQTNLGNVLRGDVFKRRLTRRKSVWKAGQFMNLKADAPFFEAAFNAWLADKLLADGYGIRRTERGFYQDS
jgi:hypothetical protein